MLQNRLKSTFNVKQHMGYDERANKKAIENPRGGEGGDFTLVYREASNQRRSAREDQQIR